MKGSCKTYRDEIADVAEGRASVEAVAHVAGCPACAARVKAYQSIFAAARLPRESAPASLIASVAAMMPDLRRSIVARRLSALVPTAARRQSSDVQIVVGDEETSIRVLARADGDEWIVMGRLPEGEWNFDGPPAEIQGDRFTFRASDLGATAFAIESEVRRLEIPPIAELLQGETDGG